MSDPCLMISADKNGLKGMIILQVDDSLGIGTSAYMREEEVASNEFRSKPRRSVKGGQEEFNGSMVTQV